VDLSPGERRSGAHAARREAGPAPRSTLKSIPRIDLSGFAGRVSHL